jgi:PLP dependent protein
MIEPIAENLARVRERIARAEEKAGRPAGAVRLVGVTKNRTVEEIEAALACGLADIGENRVQEALEKFRSLRTPVNRHFIGHLQRNKVRDVTGVFDLLQSVDSERLALAVDERAAALGLRQKVLMQVNTSGEDTKFGVEPARADRLLEVISGAGHLDLAGLMTIGPLTENLAAVVESFRTLHRLFERYASQAPANCRMEILSMGMSSDFEIAIAEGANMVRVGSAIFGQRAA